MKVLINGGGIAGLTAAIALIKSGFSVTIFESAPQITAAGAGLVIQPNALKALEYFGIADQFIESANPIDQLAILNQRGRVIKEQRPSARFREQFTGFAIHRQTLHGLLQSFLPNDIYRTGRKAVSFSQTENSVSLRFDDGTEQEGDYLISADGIHSPIRMQLLPESKPRYAGYLCWRSVISNADLKIKEATETWGSRGRFGIVPVNGNRLYWFAVINSSQYDVRMKHVTVRGLRDHFADYHPLIGHVLDVSSDSEMLMNSICDILPLSRFAFGRVLLIGDAAHATTPNLGQGACQAIEDVMVLHQEIASGRELHDAFSSFEKRRIKKAAYIIDTSRRLGQIAQADNKLLIPLRNFALKCIPEFVTRRQFQKIYHIA
ncbi:MAG: FAD-dependent monooxygenase [Ignavibacteriales bacterium]|nr:MAG: FAD-dependent monooxygenase [Ignavibacteriales bacterium]